MPKDVHVVAHRAEETPPGSKMLQFSECILLTREGFLPGKRRYYFQSRGA